MYVSGMGVDRTLIDSRISDSQFPNCFLATVLPISYRPEIGAGRRLLTLPRSLVA